MLRLFDLVGRRLRERRICGSTLICQARRGFDGANRLRNEAVLGPLHVVSHAERPELLDHLDGFEGLWPELIFHDAVARRLYQQTRSTFAQFNLYLLNDAEVVVACGLGVPLHWSGIPAQLPSGWDAALEQSVADHVAGAVPTALCAVGAMVARSHQGRGLSRYVVRALKAAAGTLGSVVPLVAPVRPTWKELYPRVPMDEYIAWRRPDGSPFDPWLRVHWREGGEMLGVAHRSMVVAGRVADWESWTGLTFPVSGAYVVPGALTVVQIEREIDEGRYEEPNVWMLHRPVP